MPDKTAYDTQVLLSLPPTSAANASALEGMAPPAFFATCDPEGARLGSGGGTAHLLVEAWRATADGNSFRDWLRGSRKLVVHAGGESRRLPAYAAVGKTFAPAPVWRWSLGQNLGQNLLDLQLPLLRTMLDQAPSTHRVAVTSGDVLLHADCPTADIPDADVVCFGLWAPIDQASRHGVFFCPRQRPGEMRKFLQKPSVERIRELSRDDLFLIDTGFWLLSEKAVMALMKRCGWQDGTEQFSDPTAHHYELYGEFGLGLGTEPSVQDPGVKELTCAVVAIPDGQFHHLGSSRELISTTSRLQNLVIDQERGYAAATKPHPDMFTLNARIETPLEKTNHTLWIENSHVPAGWALSSEHVLTGIPENDWTLALPPGVCVDMIPVGDEGLALRPYGIDDPFRGAMSATDTLWMGESAPSWFEKRSLDMEACGVSPDADIQHIPIFPISASLEQLHRLLVWMMPGGECRDDARQTATEWMRLPRLSASEIGTRANLPRLYEQRARYAGGNLKTIAAHRSRSVFFRLDLKDTAQRFAHAKLPLPPAENEVTDPVCQVREAAFRATVTRIGGDAEAAENIEAEAFEMLRDSVVAALPTPNVAPTCTLHEDQIVWARSPVRLDLAGGWTDTPPYCFVHGASVVNLAVDLNGQPPIQVFVRRSEKPVLALRSIDLGADATLRTYDDVRGYATVGDPFSIVRAALALAGFTPEFCATRFPDLQQQLQALGGGLEISFLAAVPKGSGLGTSSILAAAILSALSDSCGLGWDRFDIVQRTLALEQLLTTGGGWQDQVGGVFPGIKHATSTPGFDQTPLVRWLPERLLEDSAPRMLLYYTGITRVAKNILQEVVRGMFLNAREQLSALAEIGWNAQRAHDAIQRADWNGLCQAVARSWQLNQRLDPSSNPDAVRDLLQSVDDRLAAAKLLGAGGGGFLLMLAKDEEGALSIRRQLTEHPPTPSARFVDMTLSKTGCVVTRS
ncbi:MAG: bifunctional fucokinase/L-fucose-1-P-guanylyltransferase [Lentisphaeria bacterium]|nr:bifunctional fucokinase/L-fucose-1-P-guanylyltransferase [Lentisphaeria bacterium]